MIAVSLNVGSGVRHIKPAKLYICTQTHYKHDEDGRMAPGVCGHGSVLLSHSGIENGITQVKPTDLAQGQFFYEVPDYLYSVYL